MTTPISATKETISKGYDGPVLDRASDYLNRWPLAREVYGIATTGSKDWSVRVGVYGEWGSGKTSVLKFVTHLAEKDGHIVVWFNPWEHSTKAQLWRAFVSDVFAQLQKKLGKVPGANMAKAKEWADKAGIILGHLTGVINEDVGKATEVGLDLVKNHFTAGSGDFKAVQPILGDKRVIILIDDLDRTSRELVPEILFALKELMDIPGFSFICAFDPLVVGEVLGEYHPGFGDGLKFLDKIIDYPRWLPPATTEGLTKLALADAKLSCAFVPDAAIRDAIPLLPSNPRSVRQFIRILALLKPQLLRHSDSELSWSTIIAANILKVRYPRIAHELLGDSNFWNSLGMIRLNRDENEEDKNSKAIDEQIKKTCEAIGVTLEQSQKNEIKAAMLALSSQIGILSGLYGELASYQFNIAEAPAAVTWKEFDMFRLHWDANQTVDTIKTWIAAHASEIQRNEVDVFREVLRADVQRYAETLHSADNVLVAADRPALVKQAKALFALLETLCFDLAKPDSITDAELKTIVEAFASFAKSNLAVHRDFWERNEAFILKLFSTWSGDITLPMKVLEPYAGFLPHGFEGEAAEKLRNKLCALALPRFVRQVINNLRERGFIERLISREKDALESRRVIWDANGIFGNKFRAETFALLSEAPAGKAIQENAYELLLWFVLARSRRAADDPDMIKTLSNGVVFDAIWKAATATPLGPRAVYQLKDLPLIANLVGIKFDSPIWWDDALVAAGIIKAPACAAAEQPQ